MAALDPNYQRLSLTELGKRTLNGVVQAITENLSNTRAILRDGEWVKANRTTSHIHTRRIAIPTGTWRIANAGSAPEASRTRQVEESVGTLEAFSTVDEFIIDLADDKAAFILTEDMSFLEGLAQTFATATVYGSTITDPEQFDGLLTRLATLGTYCVSAGGATTLTSVIVVQWGANRVHYIYKPNLAAGRGGDVPVERNDLGYETVLDSANSYPYRAHRTQFRMHGGLAVHDDRNLCALRNISASGGATLFNSDKMIGLLNIMEERGAGSIIYCNRTVMTQVDIQAVDKANVLYGPTNVFGETVTGFRGHPMRLEDSILSTESAIA